MQERILYLVRHCSATGQEPVAPLTPAGVEQAEALGRFLADRGVERISASPYRRAVASAEPLSRLAGVPLETDDRLAERVLAGGALTDWLNALERSYADFDLTLPGGESSRQAQARGVQALEAALSGGARHLVVVTHGNLMGLLLHHFDPQYGFAAWQGLTNPDVYAVRLEPARRPEVRRIWA